MFPNYIHAVKDDWILIIGIGAIIGLVLENNKNILKRITQFSPSPSEIPPPAAVFPKPAPSIVQISTTTQPDLAAGKCPPGMYLDRTLGIYRCRSAGHIRTLSPNVKLFNPQWQNAWGLDSGWATDLQQDVKALRELTKTVLPPTSKQIRREQEKERQARSTGKCKPGSCDSQNFCIDEGSGEVIRGGSHVMGRNMMQRRRLRNLTGRRQ